MTFSQPSLFLAFLVLVAIVGVYVGVLRWVADTYHVPQWIEWLLYLPAVVVIALWFVGLSHVDLPIWQSRQ